LLLAGIVGHRNQPAELRTLAQELNSLPEQDRTSQHFAELLAAVDQGLRRSRSSLAVAWQDQPNALALIQYVTQNASNTALDNTLPPEQRTAAVRLLAPGPQQDHLLTQLLDLATPAQPDTVRLAALQLLQTRLTPTAAARLATDCSRSTTSLQHEIIECLCSSDVGAQALLDAIAAGTIPASRISLIHFIRTDN
ncbi:MAG: hypothetical protein ACK5TX_14025, partial [Planctomyces sp.]